jgi:hypothetical protein
MIVYHVSEEPGIALFEPRPIDATGESFVWAIDDERLRNYLVPRNWFERVRSCRLFCYHLPGDAFTSRDESAGYFVSQTAVKPAHVECIDDAVAAILRRGVELRILPSLWSLRDAVVGSTLEFSIIRWRNAVPRPANA